MHLLYYNTLHMEKLQAGIRPLTDLVSLVRVASGVNERNISKTEEELVGRKNKSMVLEDPVGAGLALPGSENVKEQQGSRRQIKNPTFSLAGLLSSGPSIGYIKL